MRTICLFLALDVSIFVLMFNVVPLGISTVEHEGSKIAETSFGASSFPWPSAFTVHVREADPSSVAANPRLAQIDTIASELKFNKYMILSMLRTDKYPHLRTQPIPPPYKRVDQSHPSLKKAPGRLHDSSTLNSGPTSI